MASPLISTEELAAKLGDPGLRILDASWHLDGRDARAAFQAGRIPGARFFEREAISDQASDLPHMLPSPTAFAAAMSMLGVSNDDDIVVYDSEGLFSAARVWWMLRAFGASRVRVLDGGLPKWRREGRRLEHGPGPTLRPAVFTARAPNAVADASDVDRALRDGAVQVVDARGAARFRGEAAEPRPGLRAGHMPGAVNLPYPDLMQPSGEMKRGAALAAAFAAAGVDIDGPVITTCGSGVTAAILSLGLAELGRASRLYDGSWAEWGARDDLPVVDGPA